MRSTSVIVYNIYFHKTKKSNSLTLTILSLKNQERGRGGGIYGTEHWIPNCVLPLKWQQNELLDR